VGHFAAKTLALATILAKAQNLAVYFPRLITAERDPVYTGKVVETDNIIFA